MQTKLVHNSKNYELHRYPKTTATSLQAWSNAELLVLDYIKEKETNKIHIYNDRFGVWNSLLNTKNITTVWTYASQKKAIHQNLKRNNLQTEVAYKTPLEDLKDVELALIKIPKSLELFELFLNQIHTSSSKNTEVVCGFMTKYFSVSYLEIAKRYFNEVSQSKAWKKSRLLLLKSPKEIVEERTFLNTISFNNTILKQYYGVFSSNKIDIGTQFLLENIHVAPHETKILDVASGNGIIAKEIVAQNSEIQPTLLDDFNLAIASSKLNLPQKTTFICDDNLDTLNDATFDLVVSNPPFHFEHENNIEISQYLFSGVKRCLKKEGRFVLVANKHLNYKTYLSKLFKEIVVIATNDKFVVYECKSF